LCAFDQRKELELGGGIAMTRRTASSFAPLDAETVYVLDNQNKLWLEHGPFRGVLGEPLPQGTPPEPVDDNSTGDLSSFSPVDATTTFVTRSDGLYLYAGGPFALPPERKLIDTNILGASAADAATVCALRKDGSLWLYRGPFDGSAPPPPPVQIAAPATPGSDERQAYAGFPVDASTVFVWGVDQVSKTFALWLDRGPFDSSHPAPVLIDNDVVQFDVVDADTVYVLRPVAGANSGGLWLYHAPFGTFPPKRDPVDNNVVDFSAVDASTVYVLGSDGKLWLEHAPFGSVPPKREWVDGQAGFSFPGYGAGIAGFASVDANTVYVLRGAGDPWIDLGAPFAGPFPSQLNFVVDQNVLVPPPKLA
jgi:hypothetical protein